MKKNLDMTEGKPISLLWAFTFPTLMGNLLNQVYSITAAPCRRSCSWQL